MAQDYYTARKDMRGLGKAMQAETWNSIGDLKRLLLDDITRERNAFAERVVKTIEATDEERPHAERRSYQPDRQGRISEGPERQSDRRSQAEGG